jgi:hypothetical protein
MADGENSPTVDVNNGNENVEITPTKQPKKRVITPEAKEKMLANLKRARDVKTANRGANLKKYPIKKRERAKEMYDQDVEEKAKSRAEELAKELLRKQDEDRELAKFKKWRENKGHESGKDASSPPEGKGKPKGKPAKKKADAADKKQKPKAKPAKKPARHEEEDEEYPQHHSMAYGQIPSFQFDMSQYLD